MTTRRTWLAGLARAAAASGLLPALAPAVHAAGPLTEGDAAQGVRAALERGAASAVALLGRSGGFLDNPRVRITLPGPWQELARLARLTGQQAKVDELEVAMNRAAEAAVPEGRTVLLNAVRSMSVEDARRILTGGDQSVTAFFAAKTRTPLTQAFTPIVDRSMKRVALAQKADALAARAAATGLVKAQDLDLRRHVTEQTLEGLYRMIGEEERRIRQDPVGTGSALLSRVFGSLR